MLSSAPTWRQQQPVQQLLAFFIFVVVSDIIDKVRAYPNTLSCSYFVYYWQHTQRFPMVIECLAEQWLGKYIRGHSCCWTVFQYDRTIFDIMVDEVEPNRDMFRMSDTFSALDDWALLVL